MLHTDQGYTLKGNYRSVEVSHRVGNIPRKVIFDNQSVFETADNDSVDEWIQSQADEFNTGWPHRLESRWHWIVVAMLVLLVFTFGMIRWGLPWTSEIVARNMPGPIIEHVSAGALKLLDDWVLQPSELPEDDKQALKNRFAERLADDSEGYTLRFRKLGLPNALALPSGDLIVTDSFVRLATPEEFDAVLLHEIGHVKLRHGMQQLVRSSIVTFVVAMIAGEPSGLEEVIIALPVFLLQSHYSRSHEAEADDFALNLMLRKGIDPIHFATIMQKLEASSAGDNGAGAGRDRSGSEKVLDYVSSHPATVDRIEKARALSREFHH